MHNTFKIIIILNKNKAKQKTNKQTYKQKLKDENCMRTKLSKNAHPPNVK